MCMLRLNVGCDMVCKFSGRSAIRFELIEIKPFRSYDRPHVMWLEMVLKLVTGTYALDIAK